VLNEYTRYINDKKSSIHSIKSQTSNIEKKLVHSKKSSLSTSLSKKYIINNVVFSSQNDAIDYVRNLLKRVGYTNSVKTEDIYVYDIIIDLLNLHPEKSKKRVNEIEDIEIYQLHKNDTGYHLKIILKDSSVHTISWQTCITQKVSQPIENLFDALRYSVNYQILEYKNSITNISQLSCKLCNKNIINELYHVDHIKHFYELAVEFLMTQNNIPNNFDKYQFRSIFKNQDNDFEEKWQNYHLNNATLRILCEKCNLSRPKSIKYKNYNPYITDIS
jgi:hypothetical protein